MYLYTCMYMNIYLPDVTIIQKMIIIINNLINYLKGVWNMYLNNLKFNKIETKKGCLFVKIKCILFQFQKLFYNRMFTFFERRWLVNFLLVPVAPSFGAKSNPICKYTQKMALFVYVCVRVCVSVWMCINILFRFLVCTHTHIYI